jgi:hypothetical protein
MKVYEVTTNAKPPRTEFEHYAPLVPIKQDENFLKWDDFNGRPFSRRWRAIKLHIHSLLATSQNAGVGQGRTPSSFVERLIFAHYDP